MKVLLNSANPFKWRIYFGRYYSITLKKVLSLVPGVMLFFIYTWSSWISHQSDTALNYIEGWCHDE